MPERQGLSDHYRYGFNGMEKDYEIKGNGNSYDFGARIYDPRIARWLSVDPLAGQYPFLSPYNFVNSNPIIYVDPDGKKFVISEDLSPKERERIQAALQKLEDTMPELYQKLNTLQYHGATQQYVSEGDENWNEEGNTEIVILITISDLDGQDRTEEMGANPSERTMHFNENSHTDGLTTSPGIGLKINQTKDENEYPIVWNSEGLEIVISSPEVASETSTYGNRSVLQPNGSDVHFLIEFNDFTGSEERDGEIMAHEAGHIDGDILNQLISAFFSTGGRGANQDGHQEGNTTGDVANDTESEYKEKRK